ncbi:hypothetical protein [Streptomyces sp. HUAS TT20]|uniref:hypothetical protein n=1 Tax=Streptomyces sp. HUAS TT20 TaxID=3447509 RepID=UPI0021DA35C9|nr:hypothetical protein [Streptomyces sp. HUAS 15-9]UXY29673.1 hypothetical protein N8I87_26015 [Streptomyces sp. HUAS 15-9]
MKYYCRDGGHPCATAYCDEHDCDTVKARHPRATTPPHTGPAGDSGTAGAADPIDDLLRGAGAAGDQEPTPDSASTPDEEQVELPLGVRRRYRLLEMLPAEAAVGGRLWLAAPVDTPQGIVLLKVHARGFRPSAAKERLRNGSAGVVECLDSGVETLPDGSRTVTWEALRLPGGGTLRKALDDALAAPGGPAGRLGGLVEPTVRALLTGLADLLETWERDFAAVPVNISPDTLYLREMGGTELVFADIDGAAVLGEESARGPRPPLTRYLAPAHLVPRGRWGVRGAWVSVAATVHELLTGRPRIEAGQDPEELTDALLHAPAADTGDPRWDDLLDRLTGGRLGAKEVRAWCAEQESASAPAEPFRYGERAYDDPRELVSALIDSGANGPLWLSSLDNTERLAAWLESIAPQADHSPLYRLLRSPREPYAADQALAALAAEFLPFVQPRFRGDVIDEDGLLALAAREDVTVLRAVLDSGVLRGAARQNCARHGGEPGCPVLRGLSDKVTRALDTARQETGRTALALERERDDETDELRADAAQHLVPAGPGWYDPDFALSTVVRLLVDDEHFLRHCRERLSKVRPAVGTPRWWSRLYDQTTESLGREPTGPLGATAAGLVAAALAFDRQVMAFRRDLGRARRIDTRRRLSQGVRRAARSLGSRFSRSADDRDQARTRRRQSMDLAHRRLLRLRWLWLTVFTIGLLDMIGYTTYGWVPYTQPPPSPPHSASAPAHHPIAAGPFTASAITLIDQGGKHPRRQKPKPKRKPDSQSPPTWRSRSQLWHEATTDAAPKAGDLVTSLHDVSDQVVKNRPDWIEDGAFFAYGSRLPDQAPWLPSAAFLLGSALGLRWAVRAQTRARRLTCAVVATLTTAAILWHLWADALTHTLLATSYALDFWHGTAWVVVVLGATLWLCGARGETPVETRGTGGTGARYGW